MTPAGRRTGRRTAPRRGVVVRAPAGAGTARALRFEGTFTVGSAPECEARVDDPRVAPHHAEIVFDGTRCWVRDLGTSAGTWVGGAPVEFVPLPPRAEVELGRGGPVLAVELEDDARAFERDAAVTPPAAAPDGGAASEPEGRGAAPPGRFASPDEILDRYLRPSPDRPAGRETLMFRRAFARVEERSSRRYRAWIAAAAVALLAAGGVIAYQARRLHELRATAARLFYAAKALEVQTANLEEAAGARGDPALAAELARRREKLGAMEHEYDAFVGELGVYDKSAPDERVILRVGRAFGECDVAVPKGFVAEVRRSIQRWRSDDRLARALERARVRGYADDIARVFAGQGLPPQYFFLAVQESALDERAIGPATRHGRAKGMWQFIPATARRYGLRVGPLEGEPVFDPQDERFEWRKATVAAARYLRALHAGDAQGSGLLAMACYNWGEEKVRGVVTALPESPQDRNFWRLLADRSVPRETYDYVLSIFSAAVICEEPRLFGFEGQCPALGARVAGTP